MNTIILFLSRSPSRVYGRFCFAALLSLFVAWAHESLFAAIGDNEHGRQRREMVSRDLSARGIKDPRVLAAMNAVPRHEFVDASKKGLAYSDSPLPIGEGQTISQPYVVALMTELLELKGNEKVLEIGTGSGYQAAVLAHLAGEVYTIEIVASLAERAKETLARLDYRNIWLKTGDGFFGWPEKAPFDSILVTASAERVPQTLWSQLRDGGRLVMPLGDERQVQKLIRARKLRGQRRVEEITDVLFVPMTGEVQRKSQ